LKYRIFWEDFKNKITGSYLQKGGWGLHLLLYNSELIWGLMFTRGIVETKKARRIRLGANFQQNGTL
jgi:hypothetical protein